VTFGAERRASHYVAAYRHPDPHTARMLLRRVILECPAGLIPPPKISLHEPLVGPHEFVFAGDGTQEEIAKMYGVTQQTVGRWIKYTEEYDAEQAKPKAGRR
jgi:hypothetical protein